MHFNIIVLISVTLTIVQLAHTYRVSAKNGHPFDLPDDILASLNQDDDQQFSSYRGKINNPNTLSDLFLTSEEEDDDDSENDDDIINTANNNNNKQNDLEASDLIHLLRKVNGPLNQADYEYLTSSSLPPSASQVIDTNPMAAVDEEELESHSSLVGGQGKQKEKKKHDFFLN